MMIERRPRHTVNLRIDTPVVVVDELVVVPHEANAGVFSSQEAGKWGIFDCVGVELVEEFPMLGRRQAREVVEPFAGV